MQCEKGSPVRGGLSALKYILGKKSILSSQALGCATRFKVGRGYGTILIPSSQGHMSEKISLSFRLFRPEDIPFGMNLKSAAGWNQSPADWQRFLTLEPEGCFVGLLEEGCVTVGTVTTTSYGLNFGWVGMVLVSPEHRRMGIGTRLLEHAIAYLEHKGVSCVRLDATPTGKKLYDTLGFEDEYGLERREGCGRACPHPGPRRMTAEDLVQVCAFDALRFGADRQAMLELLFRQSGSLAFVVGDNRDGLRGYLMARPGANAFQIGPWMADSPDTAEQLLCAGLTALDGRPVFLDVLVGHNPGPEILGRYGFRVQRPFIRMFRGRHLHPGQPASIFAICGVETG